MAELIWEDELTRWSCDDVVKNALSVESLSILCDPWRSMVLHAETGHYQVCFCASLMILAVCSPAFACVEFDAFPVTRWLLWKPQKHQLHRFSKGGTFAFALVVSAIVWIRACFVVLLRSSLMNFIWHWNRKNSRKFCDEMWLHIYKMFAQYQTCSQDFVQQTRKKTTHQLQVGRLPAINRLKNL